MLTPHAVITVNSAWNVCNFRLPLVRALLGAGFKVTIFAPPDDTVEKLLSEGCNFRPLKMKSSGINPLGLLSMIQQFCTMIRELKPSIVLGFTVKNNLVGAMTTKFYRVPFIPNVTGLGTAFLSGKVMSKVTIGLYRIAFAGLPSVFFQNEDDREKFCALGVVTRSNAIVVPGSGIDLQHFESCPLAIDNKNITFLMIARLLRDKGVLEFAEAAERVRASLRDARFVLVGPADVDNRTAINAETINQWVEKGALSYHGPCDDVRPLIRTADCVVLPSYREGAPRTLIEAAAMARPVIATRVAGCTAVVSEGRTGLLCEARDPVSLANAMEAFLGMSVDERRAMGLAGRKKMEQEFDQSLVVDAYLRAIEASTDSSWRA